MTTLSIIVPVYNAEHAIAKCVGSILNQEYQDFELILINDGSTDGSKEILDTYQAKDQRVKVVHQTNHGVSSTRNIGLELAQGTYIQFLDADDWIPSDSSKLLVRAMEENQVDLVVGDFYRVVGNNLSRKGSIKENGVLSRQAYAEWMLESPADYYYGVLWNKLYRKAIIDEYHIQLDPSLDFCEDFVFNLEYILHCKTIYPLQVPVYYYMKTEGSLVSQNLNPLRIMEMKTGIYQYYNNFFKNVFDEKEYRQERMAIARFFVSAANDELTIPFLPGTKRLGEEGVPAYYQTDEQPNMILLSYYLRKLFDQYLQTIGYQYELDLKDMKVLYALQEAQRTLNPKEVSDFTGLMQTQVLLSVQKLIGKGYVKMHIDFTKIELEDHEELKEIQKRIQEAQQDLYQVSFAGLKEDEIDLVHRVFGVIYQNVKKGI